MKLLFTRPVEQWQKIEDNENASFRFFFLFFFLEGAE